MIRIIPRLIPVLIGLMISTSGHFANASAGTPYAKLEVLFEAGGPVEFEQIVGWTAGRCYYSTRPNEARGALLAAETHPRDPSGGPLMSYGVRKILYIDHAVPDAFDDLDVRMYLQVRGQIDTLINDFTEPVRQGRDLVSTFRGRYQFIAHLRESQGYFVARLSFPAVSASAYCYYFKGPVN